MILLLLLHWKQARRGWKRGRVRYRSRHLLRWLATKPGPPYRLKATWTYVTESNTGGSIYKVKLR